MPPHDIPSSLVTPVISCAVGLAVTGWLLFRSLKNGRVGQSLTFRPADRQSDPFGFWASLSIGVGLFLAAAIVAARWTFAW
jgi:hypothetical protein